MGCSMGEDANNSVDPTDISDINKSETEQPFPEVSEFDELKKRYDELNDRFLRLAADFDNYKKRASRERETITQFAIERFAIDVLELIDNLERAVQSDDNHLREGLNQIRELSSAIIQRYGITPIESLSKKFNPAEHEAITHIPSDHDEGTIIDEVSRGYRMHEKVIRFAKVAVSKGKESKNSEE
jgi:molecular chaperone GrpE